MVRHLALRDRLMKTGKVKSVSIKKTVPINLRNGLLKMGFDVIPEDTNPV